MMDGERGPCCTVLFLDREMGEICFCFSGFFLFRFMLCNVTVNRGENKRSKILLFHPIALQKFPILCADDKEFDEDGCDYMYEPLCFQSSKRSSFGAV